MSIVTRQNKFFFSHRETPACPVVTYLSIISVFSLIMLTNFQVAIQSCQKSTTFLITYCSTMFWSLTKIERPYQIFQKLLIIFFIDWVVPQHSPTLHPQSRWRDIFKPKNPPTFWVRVAFLDQSSVNLIFDFPINSFLPPLAPLTSLQS